MSIYYLSPSRELYHYGVKGMKWGVRKKVQERSDLRQRFDASKSAKKQAGKQFNKSFNEAYNKSISAYSPVKKHRENNAKRWMTATRDAKVYQKANDEFKKVKKERKQAIKSAHKELNEKASLGERIVYNDATRRKAAKYMVDNNMSLEEAKKKSQGDARRNTAILLSAYGAITIGSLIAQSR